MGLCWLEDCLQEICPLLPEITLQPEISSSKHQRSGFFCQSTNPPASSVLLTFTDSSPWWNSDAQIFTCPIAHILPTVFNAGCPPVAATYCCTIYFAVEASYNRIANQVKFWKSPDFPQIQISKSKKKSILTIESQTANRKNSKTTRFSTNSISKSRKTINSYDWCVLNR